MHNPKLKSKSVRMMCTWYHYAFRELIKAKAALFPWCSVIEVNEAYTSKTCEECGHIHKELVFNKKFFDCPECEHVADCDFHSSKNILL